MRKLITLTSLAAIGAASIAFASPDTLQRDTIERSSKDQRTEQTAPREPSMASMHERMMRDPMHAKMMGACMEMMKASR